MCSVYINPNPMFMSQKEKENKWSLVMRVKNQIKVMINMSNNKTIKLATTVELNKT